MDKKLRNGVYSTKELEKILGSRKVIPNFIERNYIFQISRGYFATADIAYDKAFYLLAQKNYPDYILSAQTALFYHGLSNFQDDLIHLDYSKDEAFKRESKTFCFHRVVNERLQHTEKIMINGVELKIYTLERSVFEALKLEKDIGSKTIAVCREYLKQVKHNPNLKALGEISEMFGERGGKIVEIISEFRLDLFNQ